MSIIFRRFFRSASFVSLLFAMFLAGCGSGAGDVSIATQGVPSAAPTEKSVGSLVPIFRFARISNGAYFYTGSAAEAETIRSTLSDFRYEGVAFSGYSSGGQTVFRFANLTNGGYFFTASVEERDYVLNHPIFSQRFRLDSATFQVALDSDAAALPVYRIANRVNGAYLYTLSLAEVSYAVNTIGIWNDEGLKFRVPAAVASLTTYAGNYAGTYSGADSGTFTGKISDNGTIVGTVNSSVYNQSYPASGTVSATGDVRINAAAGTAGSSTFTGSVGLDYKISGTWVFVGTTTGGTFSGQRVP